MIRYAPVMVNSHHPDIDGCFFPAQFFSGNPGILDTMPCLLKQQSLLRIHAGCFPGRNIKKPVVKPVNIFHKSAPFTDASVWFINVGRVVPVYVPAFRGNLFYRIYAVPEVLPEPVVIACPGKPARHADNRNAGLLTVAVFHNIPPALISVCGPGLIPQPGSHDFYSVFAANKS